MRPESFLVLVIAGGVGGLVGMAPSFRTGGPNSAHPDRVHGCSVTDGDTLRCQGERIRLLGIDAPELPGHCREGRDCAPGDPYGSTANLEAAIDRDMAIERVSVDRYGRTLAMVAGLNGDLSCWQLKHRRAIYKPRWDEGLRVARKCPGAI